MPVPFPALGEGVEKTADIVISPVNLTANGPAHLGHAGGPFLRMDVLARACRRAGHRVRQVLSNDHFENHVVVKARALGRDPAAFARENDRLIAKGLAALDITFDMFPDTGDPAVLARFFDVAGSLAAALDAGGKVVARREKLPVDDAPVADFEAGAAPIEERFCIGGWFACNCPACGAPSGSFFCEACGAHYSPAEAPQPRSRRGNITGFVDSTCLYLDLNPVDALAQSWARMRIEAPFRAVAQRFLDNSRPEMRLTVPGLHGLAWDDRRFCDRQILFSYSSLLYAHHLLLGAYLADAGGGNPFEAGHPALLIGATAIDNTVPMLAGVTGCALAQTRYRSFDRIYFNHFLHLDGEKFSTSRGHVIWSHDLEGVCGLDTDILRWYLCSIAPEEAAGNFVRAECVAFHERVRATLDHRLHALAAILTSDAEAAQDPDPCPDPGIGATMRDLLQTQHDCLAGDGLRLRRFAATLDAALALGEAIATPAQAQAWMRGFAILASPVMPRLAQELWQAAGLDGAPRCADFARPATRAGSALPRRDGPPLTRAALDALTP